VPLLIASLAGFIIGAALIRKDEGKSE
jgi:hypothetical protein